MASNCTVQRRSCGNCQTRFNMDAQQGTDNDDLKLIRQNLDMQIRSPIQRGEFVDDYFNLLMAASGELGESWVEVGCEEGRKEMVKRRRRNHLKRMRFNLPEQDLKGLVRSKDCDVRGSYLFENCDFNKNLPHSRGEEEPIGREQTALEQKHQQQGEELFMMIKRQTLKSVFTLTNVQALL
ncbi:hypothetical protein PPACK8108_LOCUS8903 [Phakopsora pachyrhizi]|uniref:Uncharacterized protein n=1 Tax=Phakopsora pachyrhizi TaxID=170000 RepID=A0AAV0AVH1_PHAPC|nr:hypothetical protein PPACK8108_LOCUS8903 [Phakopsora pachyrhizi]